MTYLQSRAGNKQNKSLLVGLLISSLLHVVIAVATAIMPSLKPGSAGARQLSVTLVPNMEKPAPQQFRQVPPPASIKTVGKTANRKKPKKTKTIPETKPLPQSWPETTPVSASPLSGASSIANKPDKTPGAQSAIITREQHYLATLRERIEREKFYPPVSRRRGEKGQVVVGFVIRKDGRLTDLTIIRSSGIRRLDNAASRTLRGISPFEPIPEILGRRKWALSVPIIYEMEK
uniref:TonB family C-terminal domain-containing protein n=1 Tax=Candidatus Kentrum sp. FW TaxID=2126338 RepID=A0A450TLY1_9GAMM|nr:MAG: TonB family C-terminal domain-containing protein [Candidatus Kentron sp. FW]